MVIVGFDLGKRKSHVCVRNGDKLIERKLATTREGISAFFCDLEKATILLEAYTSAEWVARLLEGLGHVVVVADPNFTPMYSQADKRIKTDRRDARALCEALRLGAYHPVHRRGDANRELQMALTVRESFVKARAELVCRCRALLEREGFLVRGCATEAFANAVLAMELPKRIEHIIEPVVDAIENLSAKIDAASKSLDREAAKNEPCKRMRLITGIGTMVSLAYVAAVDDVSRFESAKHLRSYLGLVPREYSTGENQQNRGRITKAGDERARKLLVEASWQIMRSSAESTSGLRDWALRVAEKHGRAKAVVALARKLAGILYAMWRDGSEFNPTMTGGTVAV